MPDIVRSDGDGAAAPVTGRILLTVGMALLAALGERPIRLLARNRAAGGRLVGPNVEIVEGDVTRPDTLPAACVGCEAVVHLVAIIAETRGATFDAVIRQGTVNVVD